MHSSRLAHIADWHLYDTLMDRDNKTYKPAPGLASSLRNVNPLTWELKLRTVGDLSRHRHFHDHPRHQPPGRRPAGRFRSPPILIHSARTSVVFTGLPPEEPGPGRKPRPPAFPVAAAPQRGCSVERKQPAPPPRDRYSAGTNFPFFTCTMTRESTSRPL